MKKSLPVLCLLMLLGWCAAAQTETPETDGDNKPARDFVMLQFTYENWANKPDSINITGFGRGFNGYICYDFPIKNSHFSFAAGAGIGVSNIYFKDQQISTTDTGAAATQVRFQPESRDYDKYKLTTAYLEAPFELRFFSNKANRNRGFKVAAGLRIGTLVGAHTKAKYTVDGNKTSFKENNRRYLETYRLAATFRIGYGNFSLLGTYNLNALYKEGSGPQVAPYSIGFCISGL